ncbi:MAG: ImmA/IrrE family metallo-endopeptidase [Ignavibacteriae bacterium]|nr:ImmA/IrrE family metallo-endopeptidase [Ignavibacteriota bacterium]
MIDKNLSERFQGENLLEAREARSMTVTSLAEITGLSTRAISGFEKGEINPTYESVDKIAVTLNLPIEFFLKKNKIRNNNTVFFRSLKSTTNVDRKRLVRRLSWLKEIVEYLTNYISFVKPSLPDFDIDTSNFKNLTMQDIENFAQKTRSHFGLKYGPISNVVQLCENKGIFVSRGEVESRTIDAFSEWDWYLEKHPIVFLGVDKESSARSRFDIAHELGHTVLHKKLDKTEFNNKNLKILEQHANDFASAFLMPAEEFKRSFFNASFDSFFIMKKKWKTSIASIIVRSERLKLISKKTSTNLWYNYSRKGYRRIGEPLDNIIEYEKPNYLSRSIKTLIESNIKSKNQIIEEIALSGKDIEDLTNLSAGYLTTHYSDPPIIPKNRIFVLDTKGDNNSK